MERRKQSHFPNIGSPVVDTEVMYHGVSNQLGFIEIQNTSSDPVPLAGYALGKGIDFSFGNSTLAPGDFSVIAKDTNAFLSAYSLPASTLLFEYSDDLDNSGESISLNFAECNLLTFSYSDARNWPQAADGGGHSLIPRTASTNDYLQYGGNWRINGGIEFDLPSAFTLPVASPLWLVPFNPETDTALLNEFCSTYNLSSANSIIPSLKKQMEPARCSSVQP